MVKTGDELQRVAADVVAFYPFVAEARTAVEEGSASHPATVVAVRNAVEAPSARGSTIETYATFASTIHDPLDTRAGVHVISPLGKLIGFVPIPEDLITNNAFGGPDMKTLYVTAGKTLYRIRTEVAGLSR